MQRKICDPALPLTDPKPACGLGNRLPMSDVKDAHSRRKQEKHMKPSTNDQIKGTLHELKGKTKEKAGQLTNNPRLTADGQTEKLGGKIQKKIGQVEKVLEK